MPSFRQLIRSPRLVSPFRSLSPALLRSPQRKGVCVRVYVRNPKKPNSAKRKVSNVLLSSRREAICYIPGEGHTLQEHSVVLIRGGRVKDLPGVKYHLVGGVFDFHNLKPRFHKRSKYGVSFKLSS